MTYLTYSFTVRSLQWDSVNGYGTMQMSGPDKADLQRNRNYYVSRNGRDKRCRKYEISKIKTHVNET